VHTASLGFKSWFLPGLGCDNTTSSLQQLSHSQVLERERVQVCIANVQQVGIQDHIFTFRFRLEPVQNPFTRVQEFAELRMEPMVQSRSNPEPEPNFGVQTSPVWVWTEAWNRTLPSLLLVLMAINNMHHLGAASRFIGLTYGYWFGLLPTISIWSDWQWWLQQQASVIDWEAAEDAVKLDELDLDSLGLIAPFSQSSLPQTGQKIQTLLKHMVDHSILFTQDKNIFISKFRLHNSMDVFLSKSK
jgi:hypothetical protein